MPLTIAHPIAVLPFRRVGFSLSALVIGSMAPDFEYLLHLAPRSVISHTAVGLFAFCIPAGLFALWLFHRVWKTPMVAVLGTARHHRESHYPFGPFPHFVMLCCAILVGSLTHVIWDSFTHEYGWAVQRVDGLRASVPLGSRFSVPLYKLLQHGSTLVGGSMLIAVGIRHRTWTGHVLSSHWPLLAVIAWISIAGGIALGMLVAGDVSNTIGLKRWVGCGIVVGSVVMILLTTFLSVMWHLHHRMKKIAL